MAGRLSSSAVMNDKGRFEYMLRRVCDTYKYERSDFLQAEEDMRIGMIMLSFKARRLSSAAVLAAAHVRDTIDPDVEPLRAEMIRAAVPGFVARVEALLDIISNLRPEVVTINPDHYR